MHVRDLLLYLLLVGVVFVIWSLLPRWIPRLRIEVHKASTASLIACSLPVVVVMLRFAYAMELRAIATGNVERTATSAALKWGAVGAIATIALFAFATFVLEVFAVEDLESFAIATGLTVLSVLGVLFLS